LHPARQSIELISVRRSGRCHCPSYWFPIPTCAWIAKSWVAAHTSVGPASRSDASTLFIATERPSTG
jgi:hypothetical protein